MSDEKIAALARVLRHRKAESVRAGVLKARIVQNVQSTQMKKSWRFGHVVVALVLAATSSAWALGRYTPQLKQWYVKMTYAPVESVAQHQKKLPRSEAQPAVLGPTVETPAPESVAQLPVEAKEPMVAYKTDIHSHAISRQDHVLTNKTESNPEEQDLQAYQAAHDMHFRQQDYRTAELLWLAYLQAFPKGELAPEARFNHAMALFKLGEEDKARQVLERLLEEPRLAYRHAIITKLLGR